MVSLCLKWVQYLSYIIAIKRVDGLVLSVLKLSAGMALDKLIRNNSHLWMAKLKFMIANVTCAARQLTILKYFAELTHVVNTVKWHWCHGIFNHGQLDCLFNRLFRLTAKQTQKLHITEFCGNHLSPVVSPHKWVGNAGIAIDIMTVTQHIVVQYGDINLSTLG